MLASSIGLFGLIFDSGIPMEMDMDKQKYDVFLSFAGEDRVHVKKIAEILRSYEISVFFDEFDEANLWGKDLSTYFPEIIKKTKYFIPFLSSNYLGKLWAKHELRGATERAFFESSEFILPVRLDDVDISGISATIGYVDLRIKNHHYVVDLIRKKLGRYGFSNDHSMGNDSSEIWVDREACAVCFKIVDGKKKYLIIKSSSGRWIFPKTSISSHGKRWIDAKDALQRKTGISSAKYCGDIKTFKSEKRELSVHVFEFHGEAQLIFDRSFRAPMWVEADECVKFFNSAQWDINLALVIKNVEKKLSIPYIISIEGIDGSGKTTLAKALSAKLHNIGFDNIVIPSKSFQFQDEEVEKIFYEANEAKAIQKLGSLSFSLFHCADFAYRMENIIYPGFRENKIIITDRYVYTPIVRDHVRGIDFEYLINAYNFAPKPSIVFYMDVEVETALSRVKSRSFNGTPGHYEAGKDIFTSLPTDECFIKYQSECIKGYDRIFSTERIKVKSVDARMSKEKILDSVLGDLRSEFPFLKR